MDRRETRSILTALGAVVLLVAAAVIAFSSLGGNVGFDSFPERATAPPAGEVHVRGVEASGSEGSGEHAMARDVDPRLEQIGGELAKTASATGRGASEGASPGSPAGANEDASEGDNPADEPPAAGGQGTEAPGEPDVFEPVEPAPAEPVPSVPAATPPTRVGSESGPISGPVETLDEAVGGVTGIDPPLAEVTEPVTEPVEEILEPVAGDELP
jgi:hypothetical protein